MVAHKSVPTTGCEKIAKSAVAHKYAFTAGIVVYAHNAVVGAYVLMAGTNTAVRNVDSKQRK